MEYLLGSLVTLLTMTIVSRLVKNTIIKSPRLKLMFSQSRLFEMTEMYVPDKKKKVTTQSTKHFQKAHTRVIFIDDVAYWIDKNIVYKANYKNGIVEEDSKIRVDTMAMSKVELDKMIFIVDKLTEGLIDDSGDSGN